MAHVKIEERSSEVLVIQVVAYRVFGSDRDGAEEAMNELSRRRDEGDDFPFEATIEEKIKELPVVEDNSKQLGLLFSMMKNFKVSG